VRPLPRLRTWSHPLATGSRGSWHALNVAPASAAVKQILEYPLFSALRRFALQVQADYLGNARIFSLPVRFKKRKVGASETRP
jgi:hypothetical protein